MNVKFEHKYIKWMLNGKYYQLLLKDIHICAPSPVENKPIMNDKTSRINDG